MEKTLTEDTKKLADTTSGFMIVLQDLLQETAENRVKFFNPHEMAESDFVERFDLWTGIYGGGADFPWSLSETQKKWLGFFAEMIFSDKQSIMKVILSSRDLCKTYLIKRFLAYLHLYGISDFSYFVSAQLPKVKEEVSAIADVLTDRMTVADYGDTISVANKEEIVFNKFEHEKEKVEGSKISGTTLTSFPRGITHNDKKASWLILDDIETRTTLRSKVDTEENWRKYQSDALSSLDNLKRRVIVLGNHLSIHGNNQKFYDSVSDEDRVIVPLYDPKTKKPAWSERFSWANEENKINIASIQKEYENMPSGDIIFRQDYLANPVGDDELFFAVKKIESFYMPDKKPVEEYVDMHGITYRIYKRHDYTKRYTVGVDCSEGVSLDDSAIVIIAYDAVSAEVVVTANINTVPQDRFCTSNLAFFGLYGIKPFVTPEANMGGSYIAHLLQNYTKELIYRRNNQRTTNDDVFGLHRNKLTSRQMLAEGLKTHLESGSLINLCGVLHAELQNYTMTTHTSQKTTRIKHSDEISAHFDLKDACENAVFGLREALQRTKIKKPSLREQGFYRKPSTLERIMR